MLATSTLIFFLFVPTADPQRDPEKELKQLEGKWKVTACEEGGKSASAEELAREPETFTFKGESLVVKRGDREASEFVVSVKPGKKFGEIDLKHKGGKYDSKVCHAIYLLDGDTLKICVASSLRDDAPEERPNIFSTKKDAKATEKPGKLLFVLKREK